MKKIIALLLIVVASIQVYALQQGKTTVKANNKGASVKGTSGGGVTLEKRHVEAKGKSGNGVDVNKKGLQVKGTKGGMDITKNGVKVKSKKLNIQLGK